jgi:hypothetical protein
VTGVPTLPLSRRNDHDGASRHAARRGDQRAGRRLNPDPVDDALVLRLMELALKGADRIERARTGVHRRQGSGREGEVSQLNRAEWSLYGPVTTRRCSGSSLPSAGRPSISRRFRRRRRLSEVHRAALPAGCDRHRLRLDLPSVLWSRLLARRALGLLFTIAPCAVVPLGWPSGKGRPDAKAVAEVVSLERYGNPAFR